MISLDASVFNDFSVSCLQSSFITYILSLILGLQGHQMSSSSLTSIPPPSLRNPLTSETGEMNSEVSISVRPVVRRTFGRARRESPPVDEDGPRQIFFQPQPQAGPSPSKVLLNRFSKSSSAWRESLAGLGAAGENNDDDIDPEEMEKAMAQMRKAARGVELPAPSDFRPASPDTNAVSARASSALHVPKQPLMAASSTSALTALPTSSPPSPALVSPPAVRVTARSDGESDDPPPAVRRVSAKASGKQRRIIASDDEEEPDRASNEESSKTASPTPRAFRSRPHVSTQSSSRQQSDNDDDEDVDSPPDLVQMLINRVADHGPDDEADETIQKPTSEDPVGLFDDDEDNVKPRGSKAPKVSLLLRVPLARLTCSHSTRRI